MKTALLSVLLLSVAVAACSPPEARGSYEVKGVVREVGADSVRIAHDDIPGFMPAMTMTFDVARKDLLGGVQAGAIVEFTLERSPAALEITALRVVGQAAAVAPVDVAAGFVPSPAPDFTLTNQAGESVSLSDFRDRVVVLDFIFTRCPGPCPVVTATRVKLQRELGADGIDRVQFVTISVDPGYDTPEVLREYAERFGIDTANWSLLTGGLREVREIAKSYRVARILPDGTFDHAVVTYMIDRQGIVSLEFHGEQTPVAELRAGLEKLLHS